MQSINSYIDRRRFLQYIVASASVFVIDRLTKGEIAMAADDPITKITKSDDEWKKSLTSEQYNVLRQEGTEAPFTSPLNSEKHTGIFACAGCALPLFPSKFKYDSGTGWPSFYDSLPGHIETKSDYKLVIKRTEYHCARCGGHQGHVFEDGPAPTGLRYCNNGVALTFIPDKA